MAHRLRLLIKRRVGFWNHSRVYRRSAAHFCRHGMRARKAPFFALPLPSFVSCVRGNSKHGCCFPPSCFVCFPQVLKAKKEAALDGKNDDPTFRGWLSSWRLVRLLAVMNELGAYVQQVRS